MSAAKQEGLFTKGDGSDDAGGGKRPSSGSSDGAEKHEYGGDNTPTARNKSVATQHSTAAKLRNPLTGMSEEEVLADVDTFVDERGLSEHREDFRVGALLARMGQHDRGFEEIDAIPEEQKQHLRHELAHRWNQPKMLYFLVVLCAGSAIVQGMDQTAVNGAQVFYFEEFGITDVYMQGLLVRVTPFSFADAMKMLTECLEWCSLPMLRVNWVLVKRSVELFLWSPRNHFYFLLHLCGHGVLDGEY